MDYASFYSSLIPCVFGAFSNFDWAGDVNDYHSTMGFYIFFILSHFMEEKPSPASFSSTKFAYRALASTTAEIV